MQKCPPAVRPSGWAADNWSSPLLTPGSLYLRQKWVKEGNRGSRRKICPRKWQINVIIITNVSLGLHLITLIFKILRTHNITVGHNFNPGEVTETVNTDIQQSKDKDKRRLRGVGCCRAKREAKIRCEVNLESNRGRSRGSPEGTGPIWNLIGPWTALVQAKSLYTTRPVTSSHKNQLFLRWVRFYIVSGLSWNPSLIHSTGTSGWGRQQMGGSGE